MKNQINQVLDKIKENKTIEKENYIELYRMISNLTKSKNIVRYIKNMILKKLNAGDQMKGVLNALDYLFKLRIKYEKKEDNSINKHVKSSIDEFFNHFTNFKNNVSKSIDDFNKKVEEDKEKIKFTWDMDRLKEEKEEIKEIEEEKEFTTVDTFFLTKISIMNPIVGFGLYNHITYDQDNNMEMARLVNKIKVNKEEVEEVEEQQIICYLNMNYVIQLEDGWEDWVYEVKTSSLLYLYNIVIIDESVIDDIVKEIIDTFEDYFCMSLDSAYHQFYVKMISYEILNKEIEMEIKNNKIYDIMQQKLKLSDTLSYSFIPEEYKIMRREDTCVIDYLQFELSQLKIYKKESIMDITFENYFNLEELSDGVTVEQMLNYLNDFNFKVNVYIFDMMGKLIKERLVEYNYRSLCFIVNNEHLYPIYNADEEIKFIKAGYINNITDQIISINYSESNVKYISTNDNLNELQHEIELYKQNNKVKNSDYEKYLNEPVADNHQLKGMISDEQIKELFKPSNLEEFIFNETEEYVTMLNNFEEIETINNSFISYEYCKNQLKFDSSEINNKEYEKSIESHINTMCQLLLKQTTPVVLVDEKIISIKDLINYVMETEEVTVTQFKIQKDILAFQHPLTGIIYENVDDYYEREKIMSQLKEMYEIENLFHWNNQTYTNIAKLIFEIRTSKLEFVYSKLTDEMHDIFDLYSHSQYIQSFYESLPTDAITLDINESYTYSLYTNKFDYMYFNMFNEVEPFDGILEIGMYYIDCNIVLIENTEMIKSNGFYPYNFVQYCLDNNCIKLDNIKYQILAAGKIKCDLFKDIIEFCYKHFGKHAKKLINNFIGSFGTKEECQEKIGYTTDFETACIMLSTLEENSKCAELNNQTINDEDIFYIKSKENSRLYETGLPIFIQNICNGIINLVELIKESETESSQIICCNTDSVTLTNANVIKTIVADEFKNEQFLIDQNIGGVKVEETELYGTLINVDLIKEPDYVLESVEYNLIDENEQIEKGYICTGIPGCGETYKLVKTFENKLIREINEDNEEVEINAIILTPTNIAKQNIKEELQDQNKSFVFTFDSYFYEANENNNIENKLKKLKYIFVDEYSMLKHTDLEELYMIKEKYNIVICLYGDMNQCQSVETLHYDYDKSTMINELVDGNMIKLNYKQEFARFDNETFNIITKLLNTGMLDDSLKNKEINNDCNYAITKFRKNYLSNQNKIIEQDINQDLLYKKSDLTIEETFTIKETKSIFENLICYEIFDLDVLDKLIESEQLHNMWDRLKISKFGTEKQQLIKYKNRILENGIQQDDSNLFLLPVKYNTLEHHVGRVYPEEFISLCELRCEMRHTLASKNYIDIDIENCHPQILNQLCAEFNVTNVNLNKYCTERKSIRNEIKSMFKIEDWETEMLMIKLLNNGSLSTFFEEEEIELTEEIKKSSIYNYLVSFEEELKTIANLILKLNKDFIDEYCSIKSKETDKVIFKRGMITGMYLQNFERLIMEHVYNYMNEQGLIINNDCVLCFDGIMINKNNYKDDKILIELKQLIKNKFDLDLTFEIKNLDSGYNVDKVVVKKSYKEISSEQINKQISNKLFKSCNIVKNQLYICNINDKHEGIYNSELYIVEDVNEIITIKNKSTNELKQIEKEFFVNNFELGYANTIYRFQGYTIKEEFNIFNVEYMSLRELYTSISRCQSIDNVHFEFTEKEFKNQEISNLIYNVELKPLNDIDEKYENGEIYGLKLINEDEYFYIGQTIRTLQERFNEHIDVNQFNQNQNKQLKTFIKENVDDIEIVLIKDYPCSSLFELLKEEACMIKKYNTDHELLNKTHNKKEIEEENVIEEIECMDTNVLKKEININVYGDDIKIDYYLEGKRICKEIGIKKIGLQAGMEKANQIKSEIEKQLLM